MHNVYTMAGYESDKESEEDSNIQIDSANFGRTTGARARGGIAWLSRDLAKLRRRVGSEWRRIAELSRDHVASDHAFTSCDEDPEVGEFDCDWGFDEYGKYAHDVDDYNYEYDCENYEEGYLCDEVDEHWSTGL